MGFSSSFVPFLVVIALILMVSVPVLIVTVSIFAAVAAWRKKHGLEIFYDNSDPMCHHFNERSVDGKGCYFTRLKITNKSKTSAENCRGRLATIKDHNGTSGSSRWTNSELGWDKQEAVGPVNIGPDGDYKYLDIGWVNKGEDGFKIRTDQSSQGIEVHRPHGHYYFHIVVSANGLKTIKQWFRVE